MGSCQYPAKSLRVKLDLSSDSKGIDGVYRSQSSETTSKLGSDGRDTVKFLVVGLLAFWRRVPFIVVVILAMASTAVVRLLA